MKNFLNPARVVIGIYVLFLVVVLFLRRAGAAGDLLCDVAMSWQLLLLVLGIVKLFSTTKVIGVVLTFIGAFTMLPLFTDVVPGLGDFVRDRRVWLAVPIFVGVAIAVSEVLAYRRRRKLGSGMAQETETDNDGRMDLKTVMGELDSVVELGENECFRGGRVRVVIGGADVDLRRCRLAPGVTELEVSVVMGSLRLVVPEDWYVSCEVSSELGGAADRRARNGADPKATLLVKGGVSLGVMEIVSERV